MTKLEIKVDEARSRIRTKGRLFAGSAVLISVVGYESATVQVGFFAWDKRIHDWPEEGVRLRVFPPPGLKLVALSERTQDGRLWIDLNTQNILGLFQDGESGPGSEAELYVYLWDARNAPGNADEKPQVIGRSAATIEWSPVFFTPEKVPVMMKGEKGDPGEQGPPGPPGEGGGGGYGLRLDVDAAAETITFTR